MSGDGEKSVYATPAYDDKEIYIKTVAYKTVYTYSSLETAAPRYPTILPEIWNEADQIPSTPAVNLTLNGGPIGVVEHVSMQVRRVVGAAHVLFELDPTALAQPPANPNPVNSGIAAVIPANWGSAATLLGSYQPTLITLGGLAVPYDGHTWILDGINHVLAFPKDVLPTAVKEESKFILTFYRYTGSTGGQGGAGGGVSQLLKQGTGVDVVPSIANGNTLLVNRIIGAGAVTVSQPGANNPVPDYTIVVSSTAGGFTGVASTGSIFMADPAQTGPTLTLNSITAGPGISITGPGAGASTPSNIVVSTTAPVSVRNLGAAGLSVIGGIANFQTAGAAVYQLSAYNVAPSAGGGIGLAYGVSTNGTDTDTGVVYVSNTLAFASKAIGGTQPSSKYALCAGRNTGTVSFFDVSPGDGVLIEGINSAGAVVTTGYDYLRIKSNMAVTTTTGIPAGNGNYNVFRGPTAGVQKFGWLVAGSGMTIASSSDGSYCTIAATGGGGGGGITGVSASSANGDFSIAQTAINATALQFNGLTNGTGIAMSQADAISPIIVNVDGSVAASVTQRVPGVGTAPPSTYAQVVMPTIVANALQVNAITGSADGGISVYLGDDNQGTVLVGATADGRDGMIYVRNTMQAASVPITGASPPMLTYQVFGPRSGGNLQFYDLVAGTGITIDKMDGDSAINPITPQYLRISSSGGVSPWAYVNNVLGPANGVAGTSTTSPLLYHNPQSAASTEASPHKDNQTRLMFFPDTGSFFAGDSGDTSGSALASTSVFLWDTTYRAAGTVTMGRRTFAGQDGSVCMGTDNYVWPGTVGAVVAGQSSVLSGMGNVIGESITVAGATSTTSALKWCTIAGGKDNKIGIDANSVFSGATIGGGEGNTIGIAASGSHQDYAVICGGNLNAIKGLGSASGHVIVGGHNNTIGDSSHAASYSAILGGNTQTVLATYATVIGGLSNNIDISSLLSSIGTAARASITGGTTASVGAMILNGLDGLISDSPLGVIIGGGDYSTPYTASTDRHSISNSPGSMILGGRQCGVSGNSQYSAIISAGYSTCSGANYSVIIGGSSNTITTATSVAAIACDTTSMTTCNTSAVIASTHSTITNGTQCAIIACPYWSAFSTTRFDTITNSRSSVIMGSKNGFLDALVMNTIDGSGVANMSGNGILFSTACTMNGNNKADTLERNALIACEKCIIQSDSVNTAVSGGGTSYTKIYGNVLLSVIQSSTATARTINSGTVTGIAAAEQYGGIVRNNLIFGLDHTLLAQGDSSAERGVIDGNFIAGRRVKLTAQTTAAPISNSTFITGAGSIDVVGVGQGISGSIVLAAGTSSATALSSSNLSLTSGSLVLYGEKGVRLYGGTSGVPTLSAYVDATSGAWTVGCDRNLKENFVALDCEDMLARLEQLPLYQYNYKGQPASVTTRGPVAQEWHPLFPCGKDPLGISTQDIDGVALAAVKGLAMRVAALAATVAEQAGVIAELQARLATM